MDIIELENPEDIVESFIDCACETDLHCKTVAIIANKDLVLHAMNKVMEYDVFNIRRVDIEMNDIEYMISIDKDSNLVVQPVEYYKDKFFEDIDIAYISMDGDICQITIDRLINSDKDVILFGLEDEDSCDGDCENCELHGLESENQSDSDVKITINGKPATASEALEVVKELESRMEHMNDIYREMDAFRKLFNW
jgi:hypothetical protein